MENKKVNIFKNLVEPIEELRKNDDIKMILFGFSYDTNDVIELMKGDETDMLMLMTFIANRYMEKLNLTIEEFMEMLHIGLITNKYNM